MPAGFTLQAHTVASVAVGSAATPAGFGLQANPPAEEVEIEQARKKMRRASSQPAPEREPSPPEDRLHKSPHLNTSPNHGNRFGA